MASKVTQLLHEYQDLFPTKFSEKKGIIEAMEDILMEKLGQPELLLVPKKERSVGA